MTGRRVTYRTVDGVRIPGTWRHAFIRNGSHFLTDLFIYADGLVDCWGLMPLEEFEEKLRTGWVATELPEGAPARVRDVGSWRFAEPRSRLTPELLLAEVRDTVDRLNDRPDAAGRCLAAVDVFLADRTERNRAAAGAAFLAVPPARRPSMLGDMDVKDWPLRTLAAGPGGTTYLPPDPPVTRESYDRAVAYLEERARMIAERSARTPSDGPAVPSAPDGPYAPAVQVPPVFLREAVTDPGAAGLHNDYPAPITVGGVEHRTVTHAYWSLAAADPEVRDRIAAAPTAREARAAAAAGARRDGWEHARAAVMTGLLRAKYAQHRGLAEVLVATGDATLTYQDLDSAYWGDSGERGRNWAGRLLELVRSELHAHRAGLPEL